MLQNMVGILNEAQRRQNAVASINIYSLESIRGALLAAQDHNAPIILSFATRYQKNISLSQAAYLAMSCSQDLSVPFTLHLDHCSDMALIQTALKSGFTSVMYDGSALPFQENASRTKQVVDWAHEFGASTEAELGAIRTGLNAAEDSGDRQMYTDPAEAAEFVALTGVDALAVSIGTVHGMYQGTPHIRVDVLRAIHEAVDIPLVLHGGSGTGKALLQETIRNGICKVNINTEISMYCIDQIRRLLETQPYPHLSELALKEIQCVKEAAGQYIDLLSMNDNKGGIL